MDGWIKWLGEVVWRLTHWPDKVYGNEREENFWYRSYGIGSLILALLTGLWLVSKFPGPVSQLVSLATSYTGADKPLAQSYIGGVLVLVIGVPMVVCGVFMLATLIVFVGFLVIGVTKGFGLALGWAVAKYFERHPKEAQAAVTGAMFGAILGWLAGLYVTRSRNKQEIAATNEQEPSPSLPKNAPEVLQVPPEVMAALQSGGNAREHKLG